MDRSRFSFFKSYYESFKDLPENVVGLVVKAMGAYFFEGEEPELEGLAKSVFSLIKPVMDSSKKKAENGAKGGAPEGNTNALKQAKNNLKTSKKQANDKQKQAIRNRNKEKDIGEEDIGVGNINTKEKPVYFPNDEVLNSAFEDFIAHRKTIKKPMGEKAIELAINKLGKLSGGDNEKAIEIINQSIMNGWQGLFEVKGNGNSNSQSIQDKWRNA